MKLYEHQERALTLTNNFNRCAFFLDMGLGKTFVGSEKMAQLNTSMNLVICQKSKVEDWINHFKEYYNNYVVYHEKSFNGGYPVKIVTGYKNVDELKYNLKLHGAIFMKTEDVFNLPKQIDNTINISVTKDYLKFIKNKPSDCMIAIDMAKAEGWTKNPKWFSMTDQMLGYRASSFFARIYCPAVLMGVAVEGEIEDITQNRDRKVVDVL